MRTCQNFQKISEKFCLRKKPTELYTNIIENFLRDYYVLAEFHNQVFGFQFTKMKVQKSDQKEGDWTH